MANTTNLLDMTLITMASDKQHNKGARRSRDQGPCDKVGIAPGPYDRVQACVGSVREAGYEEEQEEDYQLW